MLTAQKTGLSIQEIGNFYVYVNPDQSKRLKTFMPKESFENSRRRAYCVRRNRAGSRTVPAFPAPFRRRHS